MIKHWQTACPYVFLLPVVWLGNGTFRRQEPPTPQTVRPLFVLDTKHEVLSMLGKRAAVESDATMPWSIRVYDKDPRTKNN